MFNENAELFDLEWIVSQSGHEITEEPKSENLSGRSQLINGLAQTKKIAPKGNRWKRYNPFLECPGIAREFASLPINFQNDEVEHVAAIRFANKYGLLGLEFSGGRKSEDLKGWSYLINTLDDIFLFIDSGEIEGACTVFNKYGPEPRLQMRITPAILKRDRFFEIQPCSLYGAMWIMVAEELSHGSQLQKCEMPGCEKWMKKRTNKRFCSAKCKQAAYRSRY